MSRQIYVNLPIRTMERTRAFFGALGFSFLDGHIWELMYMDASAAPAQA